MGTRLARPFILYYNTVFKSEGVGETMKGLSMVMTLSDLSLKKTSLAALIKKPQKAKIEARGKGWKAFVIIQV